MDLNQCIPTNLFQCQPILSNQTLSTKFQVQHCYLVVFLLFFGEFDFLFLTAEEILNHLSSQEEEIKFTKEEEGNNKIAVLDL